MRRLAITLSPGYTQPRLPSQPISVNGHQVPSPRRRTRHMASPDNPQPRSPSSFDGTGTCYLTTHSQGIHHPLIALRRVTSPSETKVLSSFDRTETCYVFLVTHSLHHLLIQVVHSLHLHQDPQVPSGPSRFRTSREGVSSFGNRVNGMSNGSHFCAL